MQITKFQRQSTNAVILHISDPVHGNITRLVVNQAFRDALEAAGKMEN